VLGLGAKPDPTVFGTENIKNNALDNKFLLKNNAFMML